MNFDFFLTEQFVWWYCGSIVVLLLAFSGILIFQAIPLSRTLHKAKQELDGLKGDEEFAKSFERYNSYAEEAFGLPWKEFVETLVLP